MRLFMLLLAACTVLSTPAFAMPSHILLLRHGEKPDSGPELSPQGWERAKALPSLFSRQPYAAFGTPAALFAMGAKSKEEVENVDPAKPTDPKDPTDPTNLDETSVRAIETLKYVSEQFNLKIEDKYLKGDEVELANAIRADRSLDGKFVVICWEHKALSDFADAFGVRPVPKYPGSHFDRAWLLTMQGDQVAQFQDLPESLLPGDDPK